MCCHFLHEVRLGLISPKRCFGKASKDIAIFLNTDEKFADKVPVEFHSLRIPKVLALRSAVEWFSYSLFENLVQNSSQMSSSLLQLQLLCPPLGRVVAFAIFKAGLPLALGSGMGVANAFEGLL